MIRTLVEIRNGRVSIQENADETTVTVTVDGALSEPAAPVRSIEELASALEFNRNRASELEKKLAEETERANQNREWADRAEDRVMKDAQAHILRVRDLEAELTKAQERYARQSATHDRVIKARDEEFDRRVLARDRLLEEATKQRDEREAARANLERKTTEAIQVLEAELERYRKAHVCTVECKPNQHTAFQGRQMVAALERKLIRRTEELGLVKNDRNRLAAKVRSARELLTTNEVIQARRMDGSRTGTTMSQAIESVLRVLSSPEPDTSQA